jgi:hypothetical protein
MSARLRQFTFATSDLDRASRALEKGLGLGQVFHDPQVVSLQLRNALYTIGDQFLEIIEPTSPDHGILRQLDRLGGEFCGYLLLAQVDDIARTRLLADDLGLRRLFEVNLPAIAGMQLHPAALGGSMLECHTPNPPTSWEWAGPGWQDRPALGVTRVAGARVACGDPAATSTRWATLLEADKAGECRLDLGDTSLEFVSRPEGQPDHLMSIDLVTADGNEVRLDAAWWESHQ